MATVVGPAGTGAVEVGILASVFVAIGAVVALVVLVVFVVGQGYRAPARAFGPEEVELLRRRMEGLSAQVAPLLILLAEKERGGEVVSPDLWRGFLVASGLFEEDPLRAIGEMRRLRGLAEAELEGREERSEHGKS